MRWSSGPLKNPLLCESILSPGTSAARPPSSTCMSTPASGFLRIFAPGLGLVSLATRLLQRAAKAATAGLILVGLLGAPAFGDPPITRTRTEVDALIKKEGRKPPVWWKKTKLRYPRTLDLSWPPNPPGPWNTRKNVNCP